MIVTLKKQVLDRERIVVTLWSCHKLANVVKATLLRTSALRAWILFLKNVEVYIHIFSVGQDKILLVGLPNFYIVTKKNHTLFFTCQMKSDIPVDAFFSFLFVSFLPSF